MDKGTVEGHDAAEARRTHEQLDAAEACGAHIMRLKPRSPWIETRSCYLIFLPGISGPTAMAICRALGTGPDLDSPRVLSADARGYTDTSCSRHVNQGQHLQVIVDSTEPLTVRVQWPLVSARLRGSSILEAIALRSHMTGTSPYSHRTGKHISAATCRAHGQAPTTIRAEGAPGGRGASRYPPRSGSGQLIVWHAIVVH